jgi:hypothetical protein
LPTTVEFEIKGLSTKKQYFKNTNEKKNEKNLVFNLINERFRMLSDDHRLKRKEVRYINKIVHAKTKVENQFSTLTKKYCPPYSLWTNSHKKYLTSRAYGYTIYVCTFWTHILITCFFVFFSVAVCVALHLASVDLTIPFCKE